MIPAVDPLPAAPWSPVPRGNVTDVTAPVRLSIVGPAVEPLTIILFELSLKCQTATARGRPLSERDVPGSL
jgi:hypothetical protein